MGTVGQLLAPFKWLPNESRPNGRLTMATWRRSLARSPARHLASSMAHSMERKMARKQRDYAALIMSCW